MRFGLLTALAAASASLLFAGAAQAQSQSIPSGSYRSSCADIRAQSVGGGGRLLTARCQTSSGGWRNTSLRYENCRGDIANNNGNLTCSQSGGGGWDRPPNGSYQQSCRNATMRGSTLSAQCQDSRGGWQSSSINVNDCRNRDIANINGRLSCTGNGGGGGAQVPSGSYQQSCRNAYMSGPTLHAQCRDSRGNWQNSAVNTNNCRGRDIANDNGRLTCNVGGGGGGGGKVPSGSYQQTCSNAYMDGWNLRAQCKLTLGSQTRNTSLDIRTCNNRDIYNLNGNLRCDGQGGGNGGGGRGQLTLYTQRDFNGRSASINGAASGLGQWSMADKALSARVGSGRWELCTEPNFRGRCITIDRNERDLGRLGMGNNISSVRPR